ncbi:MAG: hypothetical protein HC904_00430 [Blastochloris sp.]|nr:hypothetical protein [Blastochloris sp.]
MMNIKHPVAMWGRIQRCWLLSYRAPREEVAARLPEPLQPVTKEGFGFYNVVICQIHKMRPWPLPPWCGFSYWHVAYRIQAQFQSLDGSWVQGLYFLRSDCDLAWLVPLGNFCSDFRFHQARILCEEGGGSTRIEVKSPGASMCVDIPNREPRKPVAGSPFASVEEAARFLKYQPRGLGEPRGGVVPVLQIRRKEEAWKYCVKELRIDKMEFLEGSKAVPELCTQVEAIDYVWGRAEMLASAPR